LVGKSLGHFEIKERLGRGGMGEVYRAYDSRLKRDVAIKVLPEDLASDQERLARLQREAHLLASLNHPNVASIYSLEESGDVRWLVLELVEGENLEQRLRSGPLPLSEALAVGRQVAVALDAAHGKGIVHRDLKPANVMLAADGTVKVLDFGIAKVPIPAHGGGEVPSDAGEPSRATALPTSAPSLTATGALVGTAPYMSPEQIRGLTVDKRSDNWAFGCLLFELLSGRGPFTRETMADTLSAILEHEPHEEALPAETPEPVRELIRRCLAKEADMRLQDIADGRVAIDKVLQGAAGTATSPGSTPAAHRRRLPGRAAAGVVAMLVIVVLAAAYWMSRLDTNAGQWPDVVRFGAGESDDRGAYPQISHGLADLIERDLGIAVEIVDAAAYGEVAEALAEIDAGRLDFALVQNDAAFRAAKGEELLGYASDNIVGVAALYPELLHIVVGSESAIGTIEDLRGKLIAMGSGFGRDSSMTLLSRLDIHESDFAVNPLGAGRLLEDGEMEPVDAVMQWASVPALYLEEPLRSGAYRLVPVDPEVVEGVRASAPFFRPATIPARAYPRQVEEVPTISVMAILVAKARLPDDLVERILEVMFANVPDLIARHPRAADISLQTAFGLENGMAIDLHPGAEAFRAAHAAEIDGR